MFDKVLLVSLLSMLGVLLVDRFIVATREPFDRRECEEYLQTEYGSIIHEARRQVWVNDVEAWLEQEKGNE